MVCIGDVVVLNYNTGEVDFIILPDHLKTAQCEEIENYLSDELDYNLDEIHWMGSDSGDFEINLIKQ